MAQKKIFILFPDGVGLRNFAFTQFKQVGEQQGFDIVYWNNSVFDLEAELGFPQVKIESNRIHKQTAVLSRARKRAELRWSQKRFQDPVYSTYTFPLNWKGPKNIIKSLVVKYHERFSSNAKGWQGLMDRIYANERATARYQECKKQLEAHKPDMVFCTTQRATQAIAPLLAAQDLGIPTSCWVYSWDNLPKGMSTVEADHYFVWSQLMKDQLIQYYPKTRPEQVTITGTPQFEPHYDASMIVPREEFLQDHGLDPNKKYICFSGDDKTTSPLDQYYLEDVAKAVRQLINEGYNIGIIYRKVPVDVSDRYDWVLEQYKDVIHSIAPAWKPMGERWDQIMPTKQDFDLLVNTCRHCELVVNICSSMVFDFVAHDKPCIYPNYEQPQLKKGIRDIGQNYHYVHFRSMTSKDCVVWALNKEAIYSGIKGLLDGALDPVAETKRWYGIVNRPDRPQDASKRIWEGIQTLLS